MIHSYGTFEIPNDVDGGEPASTNDNESQEDSFLNLQFRHALGTTGALTFGPAVKVSRIRDFGDPSNDFAFGQAINIGNGGASTDCGTAVATGNYGPTTCGFSLADDRTALDYILQTDYAQQLGRHNVRAGAAWDGTKVDKHYAVTLQPNNFLSPNATTIVDDTPNVGSTYQSYLQDSWRLSDAYELDYGLRYDFFTIKSTDFAQGFGGFSPRLKLTRFFGPRASIYGYVGRFFEPFSFENVGPIAAQQLNLPLQPTASQFDLKPERDTQLEFGGHVPLGAGSLGFRIWQKNANDLIDDTQVGVTLLHQDINYVLGRLSQEALNYCSRLRKTDERTFRSPIPFRSTRAAKRSCSLRASVRRPILRRPTTTKATASRAACSSMTTVAAGSPPMVNTAAACLPRPARTVRAEIASARRTRSSRWKRGLRLRRRSH